MGKCSGSRDHGVIQVEAGFEKVGSWNSFEFSESRIQALAHKGLRKVYVLDK